MFFEDIRPVRRLVKIASVQLAYRWYLGYRLDELLPNHASLIPIRHCLGLGASQRSLERAVDLCQEASLG